MAPVAQLETRRRNLGAALRLLHANGPTRQADLAEQVGVNRSTTLSLVEELIGLGLAAEQLAVRTGQRGRPSPVISPSSHVAAVAIEVSSERARARLVELTGAIRGGVELDSQPARGGLRGTLRQLDRAIASLLAEHPDVRVVGSALAVHGAVGFDGRLLFSPNLGWSGAVALANRSGGGTAVGNDADLGALGELRRGAGRGLEHFVYVSAERGVGGGIVVGGQVVRGATGLAGEVGHMKLPGSTAECGCGQRGCWEAELFLRAGDSGAAADALGRGLGALLAILQPEAFVLGGRLGSLVERAQERVRTALMTACPPALAGAVRLLPSQLGENAAIVGAAELVFDRLFDDPAGTAGREEAS